MQGDLLKDLHNYGLCWRARMRLSKCAESSQVADSKPNPHIRARRGLTLNSTVEATDLEKAADAIRARLNSDHWRQPAAEPAAEQPLSSRVCLQQQLPGHSVRVVLATDCTYVDSAASDMRVPLALSLDVLSKDRADGIQYRAGLHKVRLCVFCTHCKLLLADSGLCVGRRAHHLQQWETMATQQRLRPACTSRQGLLLSSEGTGAACCFCLASLNK